MPCGNGSWTYTPAANDDTQVSFNYTISDPFGSNIAGTANLDLLPVNDGPTTSPVTLASIIEDNGVRLITQAELLANAVDIDSLNLTASNLSIANGNGNLVNNGNGSWNYTPAANDDTQVVFNYTITDDLGNTVSGVANLEITPVNDAPSLSQSTVLTASLEDSPRLITQAELLANASDVEGNSLQAINLTISSGLGNLIDNADGTWTYVPAANDNSNVSFNYSVTDGQLTTATTATLDINPVNDSPQVIPNTVALTAMTLGIPRLITQAELLINASDIDGDTLQVNNLVIATGLENVVDNGNGTWTYFSAMGDTSAVSFNYNVSDGQINVAAQATLDIIAPVSLAVQSQMLVTSRIDGGAIAEQLGETVSNVGDINGDGIDDVIMGTTNNNEGGANAGAAYVIYGQSHVISLPDVTISSLGSAGYKIIGAQAGDRAAKNVSFAGDFNGDGLDDFLISAPLNDAGGPNSGIVYVIYGQTGISDPADIDLSALGTRGTRIIGDVSGDQLGFSDINYAGDINGDGLGDIVISAITLTGAGKAYVIYGQSNLADPTDIDLSSLGTRGFQINPESIDFLGFEYGISSAGDMNGDGLDDFTIGARFNDANGRLDAGAVYVIYGQSSAGDLADLNLSSLGSRGFKISGSTINEKIGHSMAALGDVNGDGREDILIGRDSNSTSEIGKMYIIYGQGGGGDLADLDLANLTTQGCVINGANLGDLAGLQLSSAGDFNGDGINDFLISGINTTQSPLTVQGGAYVIYGQSQIGDIPDINLNALGSNGFRILGESSSASLGSSISAAGDVNGDGLDDLIIGAIGSKTGLISTGAANIIYGTQQKLSGDYVVGTDTVKLIITVSNNTNYVEVRVPAGFSVANGTFNGGTGLWTVLASAFPEITITGSITGDFSVGVQAFEDATNYSTKQAYTYNFSSTTDINDINVALPMGTSGTVIVGAAGGSAGHAVSYIGDINGDGLDDLAVGDNDNDLGGINAGAVYVLYGQYTQDLADINLASLGSRGFVIIGEDVGDSAGIKIAAAGDVNGDGLSDFVFSATLNDAGAANAGAAYIIYGQSGGGDPADIDLSTLGARGSKILGENASDFLGFSLAGNIDINGDGFDDILLSSPNNNGGRGATYVIYGSNTVNDIPDIDLASLTTQGTKFSGPIGEQVGYSVGNAGDVNGDGLNDFMIGSITSSTSSVYVLYGRSTAGDIADFDLSTLTTQGFRITGANASDQLGYAVASAGDINGDGLDDIIVSAPGSDEKALNAGTAYVVYGQRLAGDCLDVNINSLGSNGFKIFGQNAGDNLGVSVSSAGDLNADGIDDLIVGSVINATGGSQAGSAYVIFGQSGGGDLADVDLSSLGTRGFQIIGNPSGIGDLLGISVSAAGDINADGIDDLVVGAYGSNVGGGNQGAAYLIYGSSNIAQQFTTTPGVDPWFF